MLLTDKRRDLKVRLCRLMYIQCVYLTHPYPPPSLPLQPISPSNQRLPAVWISLACSSLITCSWHRVLGSAPPVLGRRKPDRRFISPRWLGNNYKVGRRRAIIMHWCRAHGSSPSNVFHTSSCRVKKSISRHLHLQRERRAYQGWWGLPVVSHKDWMSDGFETKKEKGLAVC